MYKKYTTEYAGRTLEVEIGKYAKQANGSVMINCDGTTLLVAATASKEPKEGIDFFPLSIDYQEKLRFFYKKKIKNKDHRFKSKFWEDFKNVKKIAFIFLTSSKWMILKKTSPYMGILFLVFLKLINYWIYF